VPSAHARAHPQPARVFQKEHLAAQEEQMNRTLRCHHCEDVIGVYEPMIVLTDGQARNTSRAAEQDNGPLVGECYHHACNTQAHGQDPPE
jgi:hypothetical protein